MTTLDNDIRTSGYYSEVNKPNRFYPLITVATFIAVGRVSKPMSGVLQEKLTLRVTLVQETQWSEDEYSFLKSSRCHRHYLSTYALSISYVQTDHAKFKGLLIKIKVIKGFPAKFKVLKDCNQIKGF